LATPQLAVEPSVPVLRLPEESTVLVPVFSSSGQDVAEPPVVPTVKSCAWVVESVTGQVRAVSMVPFQ
jgi:hypothetical protein